jgi:DNA-binding transcriptional MocR family regulator
MLDGDWSSDVRSSDLGATQALGLALDAVTRPGDVVAIESPAYFGTLLVLERLGLAALEIPVDPVSGLDPEVVARALDGHRVAALVVQPTVQNPTGAIMPVAARRRLVEVAAARGVPLIEDDVYGDLADEPRPPPLKAFDRDGGVMLVSSVSKTLAPGWRLGWIVAGRWREAVLTRRFADSWAGSPASEAALAAHLAGGDHERHLRRLRQRLAQSRRAIAARIETAFPEGTRVSAPAAGLLLWLELPEGIDGLEVHARALGEGIGVSPGSLFSAGGEYRNCLRINAANPVTPALMRAIDRLGAICRDLAGRQPGET